MVHVCSFNWSKANLYQKDFIGYCTDLPTFQLTIKTLILFGLLAMSGVSATLAAIFATGSLGSKTTSVYAILAGATVVFLAIAGLVITYQRGFSTFLGLGVTTFTVRAISF